MNALLAACLVAPMIATPSHAVSACSGRAADFDADGRPDLTVAAPYTAARTGSVTVLYASGKKEGLVQEGAERGDSFGSALASGDFDGDRCADLAVGVSEEFDGPPVPGADGNGVVQLYRGTPRGLVAWRQLSAPEQGSDRYGAALAAGDFDGDGDDELAVGAPGMRAGGGVVIHFLGKPRVLTQRTGWIGQKALVTDQWGAALAAGDFDGDGRAELVAGAPADSVTLDGQGSATVLDPVREKALRLTQDTPRLKGSAEKWDAFGAALTTGDFNGDGRADLAIGVPGEGLSANQRAMDYGDGMVHVLYGSRAGLRTARGEAWTQRVLDGKPRYYDRFGAALVAADLNGDGNDELAIGVPGESAVQVIAGAGKGGLTREGDLLLNGEGQDFGAALAAVPVVPRYRPLSLTRPLHSLVVAAPGDGVLTVVTAKRRANLELGRPRRLSSGSGLYGYAMR
ncbi:FG-GAP repeat protein [Nonomuraea sp. NBC_01738]|uniref:FG-GAP repeat protein n=1 Tax=Nonomuraea sp. NBC_01738 TaxID=2976003 RepID=UPI002E11755C|nr:FG-GAP repeat protein [Nonomuraea sp. NBC_01738]